MTKDLICNMCRTPAMADDRYCATCGRVLSGTPESTWPARAAVQQIAADPGFVPLNLPPEPDLEAPRGRGWFSQLRPSRSRTA